MSAHSTPPRWAERLITGVLPARFRDEHLGDLEEGFLRRARRDPVGARRWYLRQVIGSIPGAIRLRYQTRNDTQTTARSMETIIQDLKYGLRSLRKSPGFAVVSIVTLALAIGVNTSIFSLVSAIVFADLPMQESETVALVRGTNAELGIDQGSVSPADYLDLVERSRSYESLSALTEGQWILTDGDAPERVAGLRFTAGLTETWRLRPVLGRSFAESEDRFGATPVAMLTHGFWQDRFGGRPDVLGQILRLDDHEYTIIGVTHPKLEFGSFADAQIITPLILNRTESNRSIRYLFVVGRLAPGVSQDAATAEVARIGRDLAAEYPTENLGWGLWSAPARESLIDDQANTILLFLQLTVGMVILIACANVANMLLARATVRSREIAVRSALGAGRQRLIRQLLTESLMISLAAATLGIAIAYALNESLIWISAGTEEAFKMAKLDGRVFTFTLLVSLAAPLVFGLLPSLRASSAGPEAALRNGRSGDGGRSGKRTRGALVTAQVSMVLTLMIVAGLLVRTQINVQSRPLGFDSSGLLTVSVALPETRYEEDESRLVFFAQAREALRNAIGVDQVELTNVIPAADFGPRRSLEIEGRDVIEGRAAPTAHIVTVSQGYLEMIGLPVQAGRAFEVSDDTESFPVAILSGSIADRYWPGEDPVGSRFRISGNARWVPVIGVAADVRGTTDSDQGALNVYRLHEQRPLTDMYFVARTTANPASVAHSVREAIAGVDPGLPIDRIRMMERAQYEARASSVAVITLFVTFAVFALIMAAVGIYGVMAYSVSRRSTEIGVRLALGAERSTVRWLIVGQGTRLLGLGIVIGLAASFGLSRLLDSIVFGISAHDPVTFIGVPLILSAVALFAMVIPARRATHMDPARTLRSE